MTQKCPACGVFWIPERFFEMDCCNVTVCIRCRSEHICKPKHSECPEWCPGCSDEECTNAPALKEVDIKPYEATVNELTVLLLEEMLARAKSGELQEAVIVGILDDGAIATAFTPTVDFIRRLGAIEHVKLRWMHEQFLHSEVTANK